MRVMAGKATDARIGAVEALAIRQPERLEAHIDRTAPIAAHNRFPRAMALSAEVRNIFRGELLQIRRCCFKGLPLNRRQHVGICSAMAVLATDSWLELLKM